MIENELNLACLVFLLMYFFSLPVTFSSAFFEGLPLLATGVAASAAMGVAGAAPPPRRPDNNTASSVTSEERKKKQRNKRKRKKEKEGERDKSMTSEQYENNQCGLNCPPSLLPHVC